MIGHEKCVADKGHVAYNISEICRRTTGDMTRDSVKRPYAKLHSVIERPVELQPVSRELCVFVKDATEQLLEGGDPPADGDPAAELFLKIGRCGKMASMDMGFEQPLTSSSFTRTCAMTASADTVEVRPKAASKSRTLSMIAALPVAGSLTTCVAVKLASSKTLCTIVRPGAEDSTIRIVWSSV